MDPVRSRMEHASILEVEATRTALADEARRRGISERPEVKRQVQELEEQLAIQALINDVVAKSPPTEEEMHAWFEAHRVQLQQPERVRVARVLVDISEIASAADKARARTRAAGFLKRLQAGEPMSKIADEGDGPERAQHGDLGFIARGDGSGSELVNAAFALPKLGALSAVIETATGFFILELLERQPAHMRNFEEARADVMERMQQDHRRMLTKRLLTELREKNHMQAMAVSQ